MQSAKCACVKHSLRSLRCLFKSCRAHRPHHNVQLRQTWRVPRVPRVWGPGKRCSQSHEPLVCPQPPIQLQRRAPSLHQSPRKLPARHKRQQSLRCPQRYRRCTRARTLQADLAKMQFARREVRIRRIVFIEPPRRWIAKQNAPASIRLQPVFVRIDHN